MAIITPEYQIEKSLVAKLQDLKYERRRDICDRATLEKNFRKKFEALNRVKLTSGEFQRLLDEIVTSDVYKAAQKLRNRETFIRDDGTPLNYTLVNIKDWCKNTFEVVNQLRINTGNSHHRYDVIVRMTTYTVFRTGPLLLIISMRTPNSSSFKIISSGAALSYISPQFSVTVSSRSSSLFPPSHYF